MKVGKTTLATIGGLLIVFGWGTFGMIGLMEKLFPPIWVLADPSSSVSPQYFRNALIISGIGIVLIIIDRLAAGSNSQPY
jgi:hypothetical protein